MPEISTKRTGQKLTEASLQQPKVFVSVALGAVSGLFALAAARYIVNFLRLPVRPSPLTGLIAPFLSGGLMLSITVVCLLALRGAAREQGGYSMLGMLFRVWRGLARFDRAVVVLFVFVMLVFYTAILIS
jgi:hypothetical protein